MTPGPVSSTRGAIVPPPKRRNDNRAPVVSALRFPRQGRITLAVMPEKRVPTATRRRSGAEGWTVVCPGPLQRRTGIHGLALGLLEQALSIQTDVLLCASNPDHPSSRKHDVV